MSGDTQTDADVLVAGAGITGIYQLYTLREAGLRAHLVEAAPEAGGTWYWNRYPEARTDSESYSYGYFFNRELFDDWRWTERFAGQPEVERYLNHVVDRFDLRELMTFDFRIATMEFDSETDTWLVRSTQGKQLRARFVVTAVGLLSAPYTPDVVGRERFRGVQHHTGLWPAEGVDFAGRLVAVVGTGSSGIQIVPPLAKEAAQVIVFQRNANWATPLNNGPHTDGEHAQFRSGFDEYRALLQETYSGFVHRDPTKNTFDDTAEERVAHYEDLWNRPGLCKAYANYADLATNR
jgi:cation diffusion facilitator CzcD-associated flavoprotein CzcO